MAFILIFLVLTPCKLKVKIPKINVLLVVYFRESNNYARIMYSECIMYSEWLQNIMPQSHLVAYLCLIKFYQINE